MLTPPPLTSKFMGMVGYAPASFHDLMDDQVESDSSSIGDVVALGHPLSQQCTIADAPGQTSVVAESLQTHTPLDPRVEALTRVHEHGEELQQRQQRQPPPTPTRSAQHAAPHVGNSVSDAQGHARQVQRNIMDGENDPPQFGWARQNIVAAAMPLHGLLEPIDPQEKAVHQNLRALVETATVQQVERSTSRC